jgi:hypothetical protein
MTEAMKIEAKAATEMLVELNEPEAWLEAMRRIADKRAKNLATGSMSDEMAAQRWKKLADALAQAQNFNGDWLPIETAPKNGTIIWACLRHDLSQNGRDDLDLERWNGVQVPLRHPGISSDGFDFGWVVAAPVGHGGFPDSWIAGWMSLPESKHD